MTETDEMPMCAVNSTPQKALHLKILIFFGVLLIAYICVAVYASIFADVLSSETNEKMYFHKLMTGVITYRWILLGLFPFSIFSIALCLLVTKFLSGEIILICLTVECISFIIVFIGLLAYLVLLPLVYHPITLALLALYTWFSYVKLYTVSKIGTEFMSEILEQSASAIFQFPFTILLFLVVITLLFTALALGFYVFDNICIVGYQQSLFASIPLHIINVCGTMWLSAAILLFGQMILYSISGNWYWTLDKSTISWNATLKNTLLLRYHVGTAIYGSCIFVVFPVILTMIRAISNNQRRHNFFVRIISWWNILMHLYHVGAGASTLYGKSFNKSADSVCQLLLQSPIRFFSIAMAIQWCMAFIVVMCSLIVASFYIIFFIKKDDPMQTLEIALSLAQMYSFALILPFFFIFYPTVMSIFLCILEDFERFKKDDTITCFMEANIKQLMMKDEC